MKQIMLLLLLLSLLSCGNLNADTKFLSYLTQVKGFNATSVHYFEQYLYVSNAHDIRIYSLSNPWSPRIEAAFQASSVITDIVNLEANRFFVCSPDPACKVTELDSLNDYGKIFYDERLTCTLADREGAMLYTADATTGLEIFTLGNGIFPSKISTFSEKWGIRDLVVRYPRIHALNDVGYVNIDVSNTAVPVTAGKNYEVVDGQILCVYNNYAWIGAGNNLVVMDIQNPSKPVIVNQYRFNDHINALVLKDNELYVGLEGSGLKIMDIKNPLQISNTYSYFLEEGVFGIALNAEYIYLAAGKLGWIILRYM